ncbi:MAG: glycosyltransferase family 39 protein [Rhodospirillaceae bacterium]
MIINRLINHKDKWVACILLALSLAYYFISVLGVTSNAKTWVDEVTYLIKSFQYVTGDVKPYSDQDPTWYMPLYFFELGLWQKLVSPSLISSRSLSAGIGVLSGLVVFDIVRRITGSWSAGSIGAATLLSVPAVIFYFGTATPIATVSLIGLLAVWFVIAGINKPSLWISLCLGALFGLIYFFRQNMILLVIPLLPIYLLGLRKQRVHHTALVLLGIIVVVAPIIIAFPDRLLSYAMRLPIITPLLADMGLINDHLSIIQTNTTGDVGLNLALSKFALIDLVEAYLLPYAGLIIAAGSVIIFAPSDFRLLWIAPLVFFFLSATHYIGSLDYCQTCILPYTASFAGIGAISAGITASVIGRISRSKILPSWFLVGLFMIAIISCNQLASSLASRDAYRLYPQAMLKESRPVAESVETLKLADFFRKSTSSKQAILPIHDLITIPYALFQANRHFPVQGLNLRHSYRKIRPGLTKSDYGQTLNSLEIEGLWADETLMRWITKTYDTIVFQVDPRNRYSDLETTIKKSFTLSASTGFRGWNVHVYKRKKQPALQWKSP